MNRGLMAQLAIIFIITQALGLWAGHYLVQQQISVPIVNDDKESVDNSIGLFAWILAITALLLLLIRFAPEWLFAIVIRAVELLAIFWSAIVVSLPLDSGILSLALAALIVLLRIAFRENVWLRNISSIVATAGAGALIGASLGVVPILVFLILLAAYDFIAVFKTKHMVKLAKGFSGKNLSFTFSLPTKEHNFELGTGDMVIPLMFAIGLLAEAQAQYAYPYYFMPSAAILLAPLAGPAVHLGYPFQ